MNLVDILRLLSLAAIWGASFLFMRIIAPVIGPIPTAFFRVSIAFVGLLVILALMRVDWNFRGKLKVVMVLGLINSGIPATFYSLAAQVLPAGYSAIFNATTPLMGVLIGGLFFSEQLTLAKVSGVFLGLLGVGILTRAGPVAFDLQLLMGALACLLATTCYGFAGFLTRRWLDHQGGLDSRLSALGSMFGATVFLLPLFGYGVISQPPASWGGWSVWLSLLGLGLVCTALAYILYFRLLSSIGPVKSMTVTFLIPPFGVLWGALLLDEPLGMAHLYGGVLIAAALWLVLKPGVVKPAEASAR
ncbi:EamA domain-containing membrane protein RarD [Pseudomonas sp. NFIX10]|uniref:DMT family transporter n=1 Tax=unclassified Pseudomonas TaxID=196821 RepID=UPI0008719FEA|nr:MULTISPECIES: DMT family transporter [unclassified Pseudomonas]SCW99161.1 EamA domain-containing membrane protein RarD [Pseudomonas sp. NFACC56-3]SFB58129.1 EamA domain-containing membrane protein RarD [Pseudomonas sp. NFIX10]SFF52683.1 EamA domain-containing membrane protein RarD [Pseudomonas sp. NFACC06-1]SFK93571.1 EamA domain-containing membrane protein RarD [Pseudomonas sp. NFACC52]